MAESQAGEHVSWQNGVHGEFRRTDPQGHQQQPAEGRSWRPPARNDAYGMLVSVTDIDLNSLQYIGELRFG